MIGKANNLRNTIDLHYPLQLKNVGLRVTKPVLKPKIEVEYMFENMFRYESKKILKMFELWLPSI